MYYMLYIYNLVEEIVGTDRTVRRLHIIMRIMINVPRYT
jgi:hypothetical protein